MSHTILIATTLTVLVMFNQSICLIANNPESLNLRINQIQNNSKNVSEPRFHQLPPDFEFNSIRGIVADHLGFMWFATTNGLVRYDATSLHLYEENPGTSGSLSNSSAIRVVEDLYGQLWVGTPQGLNLYHRDTDSFSRIPNSFAALHYSYISEICLAADSGIWIGTLRDGVYWYHHGKQEMKFLRHQYEDKNSISSDRITALLTENGNLWVGTKNGLNLIKDGNITRFYHNPNDEQSLTSSIISTLALAPDGTIWAGTQSGGLNQIYKEQNQFKINRVTIHSDPNPLSSNLILSLCTDTLRNCLWIGTDNGGLNCLDFSTGKVSIFQTEIGDLGSLTSNSIWSFYLDVNNRLWIGTYNRGINVLDNNYHKFNSFRYNSFSENSMPDEDVTCFAEDSNGMVWIATDGGGVCKFDPSMNKFTQLSYYRNCNPDNKSAQTLIIDSKGYIWVGTWAGGIDKFNSKGNHIKNYLNQHNKEITGNKIISLCEDANGTIWAGTSGNGLWRYDTGNDYFNLIIDESSPIISHGSYITDLYVSPDQSLLATSVNGIAILKTKPYRSIDVSNFLNTNQIHQMSSSVIETLLCDTQGRFWIGTSDQGLNLYNPTDSSITVFNKQNGLPSNAIKGILEDNDGNLWISTNRGISLFNTRTFEIKNYTKDDGLNSNEFYPRSCMRTSDGTLYFGNKNGMNSFKPENIGVNPHKPPVYLTDLSIHNKPVTVGTEGSPLLKHISQSKSIVLKYNQSSFTIQYTALNYTRPSRNQFCYMLEGFDHDWNLVGSQKSANYTNIMPGKYTFKVKASNNDGLWNDTPAMLDIEIKPPLWKTRWAYTIYIVFFFSMAAIALRLWYERMKINAQLMFEQKAREKEHELNEQNMQYFTNISHEFRTPLSLIIAPLESLMLSSGDRIKEQLKLIYRNTERLLHLTNRLLDFRRLEDGKMTLQVQLTDVVEFAESIASSFNATSNKQGVEFIIDKQISELQGWFDPEKIESILLNLLSNAFKYTAENGKVTLRIACTSIPINNKMTDGVEISVINNGQGIDPAELPFVFNKYYRSKSASAKRNTGTGVGLALAKGLVEIHHGQIEVESTPNELTRFTFTIPIAREAFGSQEIIMQPFVAGKPKIDILSSHHSDSENQQKKSNIKKDTPVVLLVEDNEELRSFLATELNSYFTILQAGNGRQGVEIARTDLPDLIVSDVVMPEMDGFELCKSIKSTFDTSHIPVILLTSLSEKTEQLHGLGLGADDYLTKPFDITLLIQRLKSIIQNRVIVREKTLKLINNNTKEPIVTNKLNDKFVKDALEVVRFNIANQNFNKDEFAAGMNVSPSLLYKKIKSLTDQSPVEFIKSVRLNYALELIHSLKYNITEISELSGFSSVGYFCTVFKRHFGKSPTEIK